MKKIPTIFVRDMTKQPALVTSECNNACLWVFNDEGRATRKWDGTSCLVREGLFYKRRELKADSAVPPDFELVGEDEETGKKVGWVPVGDGPDDRWHREAFEHFKADVKENPDKAPYADGTYELCGPKVQGNKDGFERHTLVRHGVEEFGNASPPRDFEGLKQWLADNRVEGIVWHHSDGRMAKIKRRDFGLKW